MDWLIGIGKRKLSSGAKALTKQNEETKPYMNDKGNRGNLINKVSKENIMETVPAPMGIDVNEWLATNTLSFYKHISLINDALNEVQKNI